MKKKLFALFVTTSLISGHAFAGEAELNARIKELEAKVARLERLIEQNIAATANATATSQQALAKVNAAPAAPVVAATPDPNAVTFKVAMKPDPVIETTDGNFSFSPHGRAQIDTAFFQDDVADHSDGTNIRRLYLGFDGTMYKDWTYRLHGNFADNQTKITDAYVAYTGIPKTTLTVGQFLEPFSLEEQTNDIHMTFIERASLNTLSFARNIGAAASRYGDNWSLTAGVFGDDTGVASTDDESYSATARATYAPLHEKGKVLHLGAAASYRAPDRATDSVRYRAKAENVNTSLYSVDSGAINNVEDFQHYGAEFAAVWNNLSLQGEYALANVNQENGADPQVSAWYAYASWFLTGESRNYIANKGVFDRLVPNEPFSLKNGGTGAWEVAARMSNIDLNDEALLGGEMNNYTWAINWYPTANTRFAGNYTFVDTDSEAVTPNDDPQVLLLRAQFDF